MPLLSKKSMSWIRPIVPISVASIPNEVNRSRSTSACLAPGNSQAGAPLPERDAAPLGTGAMPLTVLGLAGALWVMGVALFAVGAAISAATVIWGTLLQRRVPDGLRGRVSSLDFFVTLTLMPISMAVAGPAGAGTFLTLFRVQVI
jgi:hypothetical protein